MKYYSLDKINKKDCAYNLIIGERSNGKTYATLKQALENFFKDRKQFAYIRRWTVDIQPRRMNNLFNSFVEDGTLEKLSAGKFTGIYYRTGTFYLCTYDKNGKAVYSDNDILGYAFSLAENEHNKANSYPLVTMIVFDEFLTTTTYLNDEFVLFMNTVSTIVRLRTDVKIYMLGNTVNKYCPYFKEMGLTNVNNQKQGTIDVYSYGDSKLKVAVEYTSSKKRLKKNNFYFAFNNPRLKMITGGSWEFNLYAHVPIKFKPKDIQFIYFIIFNDHTYQCEIVVKDKNVFTYIHEKTTPLKKKNNDLIYCLDYNPRLNYNRNIFKPANEVEKKIAWFYTHDRVYYQDNEVGDSVNNYLKICKRS